MPRTVVQRRIVFLLLFSTWLFIGPAGAAAQTGSEFGQLVPGQRIYDRADALTPAEEEDLAARAAAIIEAGAPTIVYIRMKDASYSETERDARDLMDAWDIQSAPGARDGFVLFINLDPNDLAHGEAALYAGKQHVDDRTLTESRLDDIFSDVMAPEMREGRLAAGIAAGLDAVAARLRAGPPPPSAFETLAATATAGPLSAVNLAGFLLAALVAVWATRVYQARPAPVRPGAPTVRLPGDEPPAVAGALVTGGISDNLFAATVLDLARRGEIGLAPEGKQKLGLRLGQRGPGRHEYEDLVWQAIAAESGPDGAVPAKSLEKVRGRWKPAKEALRRHLIAQGWLSPEGAKGRAPLLLAGIAALGLGSFALLLTAVGENWWGLVGAGLLGAAGLIAVILASQIRETTAAGEAAAAPWLSLRDGLQDAKRRSDLSLDLDAVLPYAVALGVAGSLKNRLKEASAAGYVPAWAGQSAESGVWDGGFYSYWIAFQSSLGSSSSGGSSSSSASSGGAGGGGGF